MKKLFTSLAILICAQLFAQTEGISYQAVILSNEALEIPGTDITGHYLREGNVRLMFSIYDAENALEYEEIHDVQTDEFGMVNVIIGHGEVSPVSPNEFNEIRWNGTEKRLSVQLAYSMNDFELLSEQELFYVPYGYHRDAIVDGVLDVYDASNLDGTLTVNSNTELFGPLNVQDQYPAYLTGDLTVDGDATFNGDVFFDAITVESSTTLHGVFYVNAQTNFDTHVDMNSAQVAQNLTVNGETFLNADANVQGSLSVEEGAFMEGRVVIDAGISGDQTSSSAHALCVRGSNQGAYIKLNGGESENKNFLTFANGSDVIVGRVEGQTLSELHGSYRFIWDVAMGGLETAFVTAEGVACSAQFDLGEAGVMVANTALLGTQWVELTAYYELNVGVAYQSRGADYAEYIPLADPMQRIFAGEVVGIKNGKVSKNTADADHYMVASTHPIVIGNLPPEGKEDQYVKIAFVGQAPVQVIGRAKEGDYILPTGKNDGLAIAVAPKDLPIERFKEIIGVAWESSNKDGVNAINVAVGLNSNDLAEKVSEMNDRVDQLEAQVEALIAHLNGEGVVPTIAEANEKPAATMNEVATDLEMTDEEFEAWLETYGPIFDQQMSAVKSYLDEKGSDYKQYEEIRLVVEKPREALRKMRDGEFLTSMWDRFERDFQR